MKKLVCMLTVLLSLCACAVPCFAANADVVFTVKGNQQPEENVVISIMSSKDAALYTTEFYINYSEDDLEFVEDSAVAGDVVASLNPIVTATEVSPGRVKVSYIGTKPLDKSGEICHLEFRALRSAEISVDIEIEHAETFDGKRIRSLTAIGEGARVMVTEQPAEYLHIIVFVAVAAVCVAGIIVVLMVRNKKKKAKK